MLFVDISFLRSYLLVPSRLTLKKDDNSGKWFIMLESF